MGMVSIKIMRLKSSAHAIDAKQITVNIKVMASFTVLRHLSCTLFSSSYFSIEKIRIKPAKNSLSFSIQIHSERISPLRILDDGIWQEQIRFRNNSQTRLIVLIYHGFTHNSNNYGSLRNIGVTH